MVGQLMLFVVAFVSGIVAQNFVYKCPVMFVFVGTEVEVEVEVVLSLKMAFLAVSQDVSVVAAFAVVAVNSVLVAVDVYALTGVVNFVLAFAFEFLSVEEVVMVFGPFDIGCSVFLVRPI